MQALGVDRSHDGESLLGDGVLRLSLGTPVPRDRVRRGPRVGVSRAADVPWRFWIDGEPSVSAFALGEVPGDAEPLSVTRVAPGQTLVVAAALDGRMRPDFPFFPAFEQRGQRCAGDVRVLADVARTGAAVAATWMGVKAP